MSSADASDKHPVPATDVPLSAQLTTSSSVPAPHTVASSDAQTRRGRRREEEGARDGENIAPHAATGSRTISHESGDVHQRTSSVGSSSSASAASSRQRSRRRRHGTPGDSATTAKSSTHRRRRDRGLRGLTSRNSSAQSQLTLCCDAVTVQRKRGLVIDCVSGLFHGGRLTAVVNCSGTNAAFYLLNALAGQEEADEGNILMNGTPVTAAAYQRRSVLIDEDFTAFEELTVKENLDYAASMRVSNATRAYTVEGILQQLLLVGVKDKVVRKCSRYVRRRLSLGKELLRNPTVMILDQPLEGLATHEAQQFLSILQRIAAPAAADAAVAAAAEAAWSASTRDSIGVTSTPRPGAQSPTPSRTSLYTPRGAGPSDQGASSLPVVFDGTQRREPLSGPVALDVQESATAWPATTTTTPERIVILSMTQPRWALLQYIDEVLLLEESRCAFCGPVRELLSYTLPVLPAAALPEDRMASPPTSPAFVGGGGGGTISGYPASHFPDASAAESSGRVGLRSNPLQAHTEAHSGDDAVAGQDRDPQGQGRIGAAGQRMPLRPMREEFAHNVYRLASIGDGSLCRALGPNAMNRTRLGGRGPSPSSTTTRGSNITSLRADVDHFLQRCAAGEFTLTGWQYSSPGGLVQLLYLFKYSLLQVRNNFIADMSLFVAMITLAVVLAAIYGSQEGQIGMQNRVGILFFLVSTTLLQSILSLESTRREYLSFQRHRAHGYYSTWVYLTFRVVTCAITRFFVASVFALVIFLISNFGMPWGQYAPIFELAVIIAITSFTGYFMVFFTCTFLLSLRVEALLLFAVYTLNLVLAGLVLNLTTLPVVVQYASFAGLLRLAFESCVVTQFWDQSFGCDTKASRGGHAALVDFLGRESLPLREIAEGLRQHSAGAMTASPPTMCYTGREYAGFLGFDDARRWQNVAGMAGMAGGFVVLSFFMMALYRPRRKAKGGL